MPPDPKNNKSNSKSFWLILCITFIIVVAILFVIRVILFKSQAAEAKLLDFIIMVVLSFSVAAFFFGMFEGHAEGEGRLLAWTFRLGGPIVVVPLLILLYMNWGPPVYITKVDDSNIIDSVTTQGEDSSMNSTDNNKMDEDGNGDEKENGKESIQYVTYSLEGKVKRGNIGLGGVSVKVEGFSDEPSVSSSDGSFSLLIKVPKFIDEKRIKLIFDKNGETKSTEYILNAQRVTYYNIGMRYD